MAKTTNENYCNSFLFLFYKLDEIQDKHTEILTSREQELTKLRLTLQRIEDESNLRLHDLERCQKRISEQDEDIKSLTREVQLQQQHSKELSEHLLIKDAEVSMFRNFASSPVYN